MKIHRFYVPETKLSHEFWFNKPDQINQWLKVLRFKHGQQIVLFNGTEERLYEIKEIEPAAVLLELVTELKPKVPKKNIYLFWSVLKKDKND